MCIGIKESLNDFSIKAPSTIGDLFTATGTVYLTKQELDEFYYALLLVEEQLNKDNIDMKTIHPFIIIFTANGSFTVESKSKLLGGVTIGTIIYVMDFIRSLQFLNYRLAIYIEELCHHLWNICDETEVKYKVLQIMHQMLQDLQITDIYIDGVKYVRDK